MNAALRKYELTVKDYLLWEEQQEVRHEYWRGEVFAMAGASDAHNSISLNVASVLRSGLKQTPCRVFMSDMKLKVDYGSHLFYPDVMVCCDERDKAPESKLVKAHPKVIIEVLSESTRDIDRTHKFELYRSIPELEEMVFIEQSRPYVELFRRQLNGAWLFESVRTNDVVFQSVDTRITIEELYENVDFQEMEQISIKNELG